MTIVCGVQPLELASKQAARVLLVHSHAVSQRQRQRQQHHGQEPTLLAHPASNVTRAPAAVLQGRLPSIRMVTHCLEHCRWLDNYVMM